MLELRQLGRDRADRAGAVHRLGDDAAAAHLADVLAEVADGHAAIDGDLALVGLLLADDHPEDRGLAGAVRTDEPDLLAPVEALPTRRGRGSGGRAACRCCRDGSYARFIWRWLQQRVLSVRRAHGPRNNGLAAPLGHAQSPRKSVPSRCDIRSQAAGTGRELSVVSSSDYVSTSIIASMTFPGAFAYQRAATSSRQVADQEGLPHRVVGTHLILVCISWSS